MRETVGQTEGVAVMRRLLIGAVTSALMWVLLVLLLRVVF